MAEKDIFDPTSQAKYPENMRKFSGTETPVIARQASKPPAVVKKKAIEVQYPTSMEGAGLEGSKGQLWTPGIAEGRPLEIPQRIDTVPSPLPGEPKVAIAPEPEQLVRREATPVKKEPDGIIRNADVSGYRKTTDFTGGYVTPKAETLPATIPTTAVMPVNPANAKMEALYKRVVDSLPRKLNKRGADVVISLMNAITSFQQKQKGGLTPTDVADRALKEEGRKNKERLRAEQLEYSRGRDEVQDTRYDEAITEKQESKQTEEKRYNEARQIKALENKRKEDKKELELVSDPKQMETIQARIDATTDQIDAIVNPERRRPGMPPPGQREAGALAKEGTFTPPESFKDKDYGNVTFTGKWENGLPVYKDSKGARFGFDIYR